MTDPTSSTLAPAFEWVPPDAPPQLLFVLLHGEADGPETLLALADALHHAFPRAAIVAPVPSGDAWYPTVGLSDDNRSTRVAQAASVLLDFVREQQQRFGLSEAQTALAGFSQGAELSLAAVVTAAVAGRVLAFSGRFSELPKVPPAECTVHLLHGATDATVPVTHAYTAHARLGQLQGDSTIDIAQGVGHELHPALIEQAIVRLQTCVPLHRWQEALGLDQGPPDGMTVH